MDRRLGAALATLALAAAGCGGDGSGDGGDGGRSGTKVAAAFYPLEFLVARIGGDDVDITSLTEPGAEPHDVELTARQTAAVSDSDLVVYLRGFQPAVDEAVDEHAPSDSLDVSRVLEVSDDPHVWLDPAAYRTLAGAVGKALREKAPGDRAGIEDRTSELQAELEALDDDFRAGLKACERTDIVTSHDAFGHLATTYGLRQVAIAGLTPDQEPSPKRLAEVADFAKSNGVTTIFFEELVSPRTARALAAEVGAKTAVLSPLEGPPEDGDYFTAMRANLAALRTALGCR